MPTERRRLHTVPAGGSAQQQHAIERTRLAAEQVQEAPQQQSDKITAAGVVKGVVNFTGNTVRKVGDDIKKHKDAPPVDKGIGLNIDEE